MSNKNVSVEETSLQSKKLAYSKSLKIVQKQNNVEISNERMLLNKLDFPYNRANKVILAAKSGNGLSVASSSSTSTEENSLPMKKVSDLIKNLNSQQNPPVMPVWKDLAIKKKNAW